MYAANSGHAEVLSLLLDCGAVVQWRDSHGRTTLHLAALAGHTTCVELLIRYGHRVDVIDVRILPMTTACRSLNFYFYIQPRNTRQCPRMLGLFLVNNLN